MKFYRVRKTDSFAGQTFDSGFQGQIVALNAPSKNLTSQSFSFGNSLVQRPYPSVVNIPMVKGASSASNSRQVSSVRGPKCRPEFHLFSCCTQVNQLVNAAEVRFFFQPAQRCPAFMVYVVVHFLLVCMLLSDALKEDFPLYFQTPVITYLTHY